MSLNGTLETFPLLDVLALLSATKKTGELQVDGGRGRAKVWLDKGDMIGAEVPRATTFVDALFEMLRLTSGNFAFDNDGRPVSPADPVALEPLLLEAQSRLGEWRSIEAVVPSVACGVKLAADVPGAQVTITAEQWRTLVAVSTSRDVEGVMTSLGRGEFDTCRMLKDLVQIGLVAIEDAPPSVAKAATAKAPAASEQAGTEAAGIAPAAPARPAAAAAVSSPAANGAGAGDRPAVDTATPAATVAGAGAATANRPAADLASANGKRDERPVEVGAPAAAGSKAGPAPAAGSKTGPAPAAGAKGADAAARSPRSAAGEDAAARVPVAVRTPGSYGEVAGDDAGGPPATVRTPGAAIHASAGDVKAAAPEAASETKTRDAASARAEAKPAPPSPTGDKQDPKRESADLMHQLAQLQSATPAPAARPASASPAAPPAGAAPAAPIAPAAGAGDKPAAEDGEASEDQDDQAPKPEEPLNRGLLLKFLNSVRS